MLFPLFAFNVVSQNYRGCCSALCTAAAVLAAAPRNRSAAATRGGAQIFIAMHDHPAGVAILDRWF